MPRKSITHRITDRQSLAQINPENKRLKEEFINYLQSTQKSKATIQVYSGDLDIAFVWCLKHINNKPFTQWTKKNIVQLQGYLIGENHNSPARVRHIKAVLSSLSNFIESILDEQYPNFHNIIHKVESPANMPVREKSVLSEEQVEHCLNVLVESKEYDKACLLALAAYSGRRKSQLTRFKVSYFTDDCLTCNGALYKTPELIKTKSQAGGKYIYCYTLAKKFKPYFDLWIAYRKERGIESEWLFPSKYDSTKAIAPKSLDNWAKRFESILGVPVYMHCLRHCFTTSLSRAGLPDSAIVKIVGWESADMVQIYNDMDADEQIGMFFDENGEIVVNQKGLSGL